MAVDGDELLQAGRDGVNKMSWENVPEEQLPEELKTPTGKWEDVAPEEVPSELTTLPEKPEEKPSWIAEKGSELLGGALSSLGKATGLPNIESLGEDIKKSPGYVGTMKAIFGEQADIPANVIKGLAWEYAPTIETPAEAGMLHKVSAGAAHLLGMGLGLLPVARGVGAVVKGVTIPAMAIRGGITGGIYGLGAKPEEEETRLGNIFKYATMFAAFEGSAGVLMKLASKIPAVGRVVEKINKGEKLTPVEEKIKGVVELGRSAALGAGAGAIEPAETWEERLQNMILGAGTFGLAHLGTNVMGKAIGLLKKEGVKSPVGKKLDITDALKDPNAKPEQIRLAARLIRNRAIRENPEHWLEAEIWDKYIDYKLGKNDRNISVEDFEKGIEDKRVWAIKEAQKKAGVLQKPLEEMTESEKEKNIITAMSFKPRSLWGAEEKLIAKKYGITGESPVDIQSVTAITPKKPMTEEEIAAQPKIIPTEEVVSLRAKLREKEIAKGKEEEVKEIPIEIKPTEKPEIIKGKPKELPPTGKIYGEEFVTVPESERIKPEVKPEVKPVSAIEKIQIVSNIVESPTYQGLRQIAKMGKDDVNLVAKDASGKDIGRLWLTKETEGFSIRKIETVSAFQRKGVATALMKEAESKYGKMTGYTDITPEGKQFFESYLKGKIVEPKPEVKPEEVKIGKVTTDIQDIIKKIETGKPLSSDEALRYADYKETSKQGKKVSPKQVKVEKIEEKPEVKPIISKPVMSINSIIKAGKSVTVADLRNTYEFNQKSATLKQIANILEKAGIEVQGKVPLTALEQKILGVKTERKESKPVERGTITTPEIEAAKNEQKVKSLEALSQEELETKIKSGEFEPKWLMSNYRNMSPELVKRINTIIPAPEFKFPELPKKVGKVSPDRFGYDIAEGRNKIVEPNIRQALEEGTEPLALKEVVSDQEARIVPEYASEADKDIIRDYFKKTRESIDKLAKEIIPAKGMMAGKLPYAALKETGKAFYQEGKDTFDSFRKAFIDLYGQEGFSMERNNILKVFNEVKNEAKIAKPEGDGYRIAGERSAGQEHETFQDELKRRVSVEYSDVKDTFMSFVDKNVERMKDFIKTVPENSKEELINKMAKNIGFKGFVKSKLSEWLKVPIWDVEIAPTVKGLKKLTSRATEISNEFLRKNEFLKGYKPSQNMIDAIINTTLKDKPEGLDKLNPIERKMVDKIFANTKWMMEQFEMEMRVNGEYLQSIAKKQGFATVDDYITDFIAKHKRDFYFPLLRGTGDYVVYAKGSDGKTAWAENFESPVEMKKRALDLMNQLPDHQIGMFNAKLKYGFKFPELLEMLHDLPYMRNILKSKIAPEGASEADKRLSEQRVQELEDILSGSYLEIWAKGRLAKREGIKGFSTDIRTVLDQYAENFPRSFVRRWNAGRIADLVEKIPEDKQQYGKNLVDYYLGRTGYEGNVNFAIRNIIYNWNLAFKPSFAILNLTQRGATTLWRAVKEIGWEGGRVTLKAQMKELSFYKELLGKRFQGMSTRDIINSSSVLSREEKDVIIRMHDRGELDTLRNLEIIGRNKLSRAINILATVSEKSNRVHSALTALDIAKRKGYQGEALYDYVTDFVHRTQWLYGKENRPVIGRGWKAPLFVFKTYMLNDLNFLKDLYPNKKAFSGAMATRLALGGLAGFYGMNTLQSALDWGMINIVGKKDWELSKEEAKNLMEDKFGKGLVDVATRGLPTMIGLEGSITFGSPELFDIAALPLAEGTFRNMKMLIEERGIDWKEFLRRNVPTVVKHQFAFSTRTIFGKEKITRDDIKLLPPEIRKRALEIFNEMPKDMDIKEKMLYAIGFSTKTPTDYYNALNAIKGASRQIKKYKAGIHRQIGRALEEGRREDVQNLIEDAKERGIQLNREAIMQQTKKYKLTEMAEEENEED